MTSEYVSGGHWSEDYAPSTEPWGLLTPLLPDLQPPTTYTLNDEQLEELGRLVTRFLMAEFGPSALGSRARIECEITLEPSRPRRRHRDRPDDPETNGPNNAEPPREVSP